MELIEYNYISVHVYYIILYTCSVHAWHRNNACKYNVRFSVTLIALFTVCICPHTSLRMLKEHTVAIGRLEQVA